jgi:hypothetical protein
MDLTRDLRRLQLLVTRAVADCGTRHPELRELAAELRLEQVETNRLRSLLHGIEHPRTFDPGRCECGIIRHNIAVELRELLAS